VSTINVSPSVLLGWYQSFYGGSGTGASSSSANAGSGTTSLPNILYAPTAPWNASSPPSQNQLVKQALGGASLFNPSAAKLDLQGASTDYKNLFALYQGLQTLYSVATAAGGKNVSTLQLSQLQSAFNGGMNQLSTFLGSVSFAKLKLAAGTVQSSQTSTVDTPAQATKYDTTPLNLTGDSSAVVPAFQGNVAFNVTVQDGNGQPRTVAMNLGDMDPSTPRNMGNVVAYLNGQMQAAGAITKFASAPTPATPETVQVNGKTVTLNQGTETWGLELKTNAFEKVTLTPATTGGPAVYLGQVVGNTTSFTGQGGVSEAADAQSQLLKFNASGDGVAPAQNPAHAAPDQLSTKQLGTGVNSIQSTIAAPDGSVYVLANVNATNSGGAPAGGQDVALIKYDSAGHVLFNTDLGSAANASGLSLAVSADGSQVAVAGQVTGALVANQKVNDATGSNTFVAVYDSQGDKMWQTQDDGLTPNQPGAVAFDASGNVYVTGQSQATTVNQGPQGPSSSYLQVFDKTGVRIANTQIATGGPNSSSGIAVDGTNVYVAGVQNGHAVVSEYDASTPGKPTLVGSTDLGDLQGGNIVGLQVQNGQVYVAGSTHNPGLNAGAITSAAPGTGLNAFAATLSTSLAPTSVAYYGGASGDTRATGMTVENGDVWITGSATGDLPNQPAIGAQDGFVAALNVSSGAVDYSQRFTGLDGKVAPTSIAVASTGESVLDQLGLPQGMVNGPVSNLVTSTTALKAGDSFKISANGGSPVTITIKATDTMASLATEISQKTGFTANASTSFGVGGSTTLEIQPSAPGDTVALIAGPAGKDALSELGLKPGVVALTKSKNSITVLQSSQQPIYGLGLPATLDLTSAADIKTAKVQLAGAISVVEQAYQNLKNAATPASVLALQKAQKSGKTPAYLASQIANYQSALTRLTAGQTGTTSVASLL
jgi:hypothetical protein